MSRTAYFRYLEDTASIVAPHIVSQLERYSRKHRGLHAELMVFTRHRVNRPLQKPALFRLSFEICGGKNWERFAPLAAAFELLNVSSYQANSSFDNKLGVLSKAQKDAQFIASMISRELAVRAVDACTALTPEERAVINGSLSVINESIYLAQYYDLFVLTLDRLAQYLAHEDQFIEDYMQRCFLGSGVFNGQICSIGAQIAGAPPAISDCVREFGEHFGAALQVANDIGDYAALSEEDPPAREFQDRLSDFRNGRLTSPLYYAFRHATEDVRKSLLTLMDVPPDEETDSIISQTVVRSGAIENCRATIRNVLAQARLCLRRLPAGISRDQLLTMTTVALTNKYFVSLKKWMGRGYGRV